MPKRERRRRVEEIEFGKTCVGEIIKTLRRAASVGLVIEVTSQEATGPYSYRMSAKMYSQDVKVILTFKRDGERVFSLENFRGTKVRFLSLIESLDYEAARLCLVEKGNQWFFKNLFFYQRTPRGGSVVKVV